MAKDKLRAILQPIVEQYGVNAVSRTLHELKHVRDYCSPAKTPASHPRKDRPKPTAVEYVRKMDLSADRAAVVVRAAEQFHERTFLPTMADVRNFCQTYNIDVPATKSRVSAIPRIFKFISMMDVSEVHKMLDGGMFSGPARLGPVADAIRNFGVSDIRASGYRNRTTP